MRLIFTLFVLLSSTFSFAQHCMVPQDLRTTLLNSHTIVEGKVVQQNAVWNVSHNMIYTISDVEVYRIFKGAPNLLKVQVVTQGGTIGMDKIIVEPELELAMGDYGVFSLENTPAQVVGASSMFRAFGGPQGFFKFNENHTSASTVFYAFPELKRDLITPIILQSNKRRPVVVKKWKPQPKRTGNGGQRAVSAAGSITSFSPTTITSGTKTVLTINGSGFGATQGSSYVEFKNANNGGSGYISPIASEYVSWSDTQIQVEVPTKAGTGTIRVSDGSNTLTASGNLTVSYAILNVTSSGATYQANHTNQNGGGGMTFTQFNDFANQANAAADFLWALDEWKCATGINWGISGTNTTTDASVSDGINIVRFDNGGELNASTLGVCASYYSGCSSSGTLKWYVTELDVTFNDDFNAVWHYGGGSIPSNNYDFQSVALHEMGHGHQLGHVINSASVMHYALSNGAQNSTLSSNEISGGNYQMNLSTTQSRCGQPVMVGTNCNTAPVANFTASPNVTCSGNGNTIQFNSTSSFNPTSYAWDVNGDNVTDYTTSSPSHTYPAAGLYSVTLTVTNSVGSDSKTYSVYVGGSYTAIGCSPTTTNLGNFGTGINTFEFNTIQYTNTSNNNDGLLDLICSENTIVSASQVVPFAVTLDGGNAEYCKIWIDYNNDGSFNNTNELVYNGSSATSHSGNITIASTATQGVILRMRVISDFNVISNACSNVSYGEINDYGIYVACTGAPTPNVATLSNVTGQCSVSSISAPTATDACGGGTITGTTSDPTSYSSQGTFTITWTYTGSNGSTATQTQTVIVDDNTAPVPDNASLSNVTAACQVTSLSAPTATDNCSGSITGTNNASLPITAQGTTVVTWTYTDAEGNSSTQNQNVIISDNLAPTPDNASLSDISAACQVTSLTAPTATDNCSGAITGTNNASLPITAQGTTVVTWTYTDAAGNSSTQTQNVIINDNQAPVPSQATLSDITAPCQVTSLTAPTASDNCSGTVTGTHNATLPITAQGTTVVTWTYTDAAGNSTTQSQNVIINDNQAPVPNQGTLSDINSTCEVTSLTAPTATDNCSGTVTAVSNVTLPITTQGTTIVTWTYTDAAGNTSTQNQNVIINDNVAPQVSNCPADMTVVPNANNCTANVSWSLPTATDNCGTVTSSSSHNPGDNFALGTTSVSYTFTDDAGNQASCSFTVTVQANLGMSAVVTSETVGSDGSIDLTVNGGVPVYTFDWDNDGTGDFDDNEDLTGLTQGSYTVVIRDGNNCTKDSTFVVDSKVGLSDLDADFLKVYPNPASHIILISRGKDNRNLSIRMTNSLGQHLGNYEMIGTEKTISIRHLAAGVYFFETEQNGKVQLVRIVKE